MSGSYIPLLILFGVSVVNALGMGIASHILNPRRPTPEKSMAYESGMNFCGMRHWGSITSTNERSSKSLGSTIQPKDLSNLIALVIDESSLA